MADLLVRAVPKKGRGVFAARDLAAGSIIEICPMVVLPADQIEALNQTVLRDYWFDWRDDGAAIALGLGCLYNHSYKPNARYEKDFKGDILRVVAVDTIVEGREITVNYNGNPADRTPIWFETSDEDANGAG